MLLTVFAILSFAAENNTAPIAVHPSADEVIAQMVKRDSERRSALDGYISVRHYVLDNSRHQKHARMVVKAICRKDGSKQFEVVSSTGWGGARKYVFPRLLEAETDASRPGDSADSRFLPENYSFRMLGTEQFGGRSAYVISVAPKTRSKYLIRGTIWVDAEDLAIVRIQGEPARNPSFWIRSVQIAHVYEKHGMFWLPVSNISVSDARIFGTTELRIDYLDYVINESPAAVRTTAQARLP